MTCSPRVVIAISSESQVLQRPLESKSVDAVSCHIAKYGTNHTEAIVTENQTAGERFIAISDCAAVMVDTSARFTDGEQLGCGAEIGSANQKLYARGPMGLEAMTTTTWIVTGAGQMRS